MARKKEFSMAKLMGSPWFSDELRGCCMESGGNTEGEGWADALHFVASCASDEAGRP